jgi:hypothetical protein
MSRYVEWPPAVGQHIHVDTGFETSSWCGEVRGIVDANVAVVWRTLPYWSRSRYALMTRYDWEVVRPLDGELPATSKGRPVWVRKK